MATIGYFSCPYFIWHLGSTVYHKMGVSGPPPPLQARLGHRLDVLVEPQGDVPLVEGAPQGGLVQSLVGPSVVGTDRGPEICGKLSGVK